MAMKLRFGEIALATSITTQDLTIPGLGNDVMAAMLFITSGTTLGTRHDDVIFSYGATDGTYHAMAVIAADDNIANTNQFRQADDDRIIQEIDGSGTIGGVATFNSWINNGMRINVTSAFNEAYRCIYALFNSSVDDARVSRNNGDAGNINTPTFVLDSIFAMANILAFNGDSGNGARQYFGFCINDGSETQMNAGGGDSDGAATSTWDMVIDTDKLVKNHALGSVKVNSIYSTGFNVSSGRSDEFGWLAMTHDDLDAYIGTWDLPTATGLHSFTSMSFKPQAVIAVVTRLTATDSTTTSARSSGWGLAFFDKDGNEFFLGFQDEYNVATINCGSLTDDQAINLMDDDGTAGFQATFDSMLDNGFKLDFTNVDAAGGSTCKAILWALEDGGDTVPDFMPFMPICIS